MNSFKTIAWITTAIFALITLVAHGPSTYRFAILFLAPMLWAIYFFRRRLHIHPGHFAIFASALVLHNLGAFGSYNERYLGLDFDTYVHFYFGFAGGFLVARGLRCSFGLSAWQLWVGTILLILGVGAIHELIEYASTLILGPEKGMLKLNSPDALTDTQKDLQNNLLGTLLSLLLYSLFRRRTPEKSRDSELERSTVATT